MNDVDKAIEFHEKTVSKWSKLPRGLVLVIGMALGAILVFGVRLIAIIAAAGG